MSYRDVPRFRAAELGRLRFNLSYFLPGRPVVIEDGASNWKATRDWSASYLKRALGTRVITVDSNERGIFSYTASSSTGRVEPLELPFDQAIDHVASDRGRSYYLPQMNVGRTLPELRADLEIPYLVDPTKRITVANLWLGGDGCRASLHFDKEENFVTQIVGAKDFYLFPPSASPAIYPAVGEKYAHFSHVNFFEPDLSRFPRFPEAQAVCVRARLEPGNILYLPRFWWHAVDSHGFAAMVNFWWSDVRQLAGAAVHMARSSRGRAAIRGYLADRSSGITRR